MGWSVVAKSKVLSEYMECIIGGRVATAEGIKCGLSS